MLCDTAYQLTMASFGAAADLPPSIGYEDSDELPVRCHWDREEDSAKCATVFAAMVDAWSTQVDGIGFAPPQADDDGLLDIYLYDYPPGGAWTFCSSWGDAIVGDGRTGCPAYIALARSIPEPAIPDYIAHEFNHTLQYAIDWREWSLPIWEGVATMAATWTYPDLQPNSHDVGDYQKTPWLGLSGDGYFLDDEYDLYSWYEYGSALWIASIDATYGAGDGTVGGRDLWFGAAQEGTGGNFVTVLDSYDAITGGWEAALLQFDTERTRVGTPASPSWASWASEQAVLPIEDATDFGSLPATIEPAVAPFATGVAYIEVSGVPAGEILTIEARSADSEQAWGVLASQDGEDDWTSGSTFSWVSNGTEPIVVGVVDLEWDDFATTGMAADLLAGQTTLSIALSIGAPADTGIEDTGELDGGGSDDDGTGDDGEANADTAGDEQEEAGGCGCGTSGRPSGLAGGLALLGLLWRRLQADRRR
jgi:hypothetical protein